MIKPSSEQACNTRSCEETRCPSSNVSFDTSSKELYFYQRTYQYRVDNNAWGNNFFFKWNGTIIYSIIGTISSITNITKNGYIYMYDKHVTTDYRHVVGDIYAIHYYYCIKRRAA